jgi:ABC-type antimicrobial peptide transport system permease subunit
MWVVPQAKTIVQSLDPTMQLSDVHTFADHVDRSILNERLMAALGAFFGALALVVACLGIFGVLTFSVTQRTREFGIRMALGATRGGLIEFVLRDVVVMLVVGSAIGVLVAASLTHIVTRLLFGVTPTDPAVFLVAIALLAAASVCAGYIPARRASRVDPLVALRTD